MINELNKVLRQLLIYDMPINNNDIDISFKQPVSDWSGKVNRPTLNLFLYDMRENKTLRETQWDVTPNGNGTVTLQRKPVRLDLFYMITAWSPTNTYIVDDIHSMLTRTLKVLFRHPFLPPPEEKQSADDKKFWQELAEQWPEVLKEQPVPIPIQAAQTDILRNPAEVWSAMENQLRPSIPCTITIALNPYKPDTAPLVQTRELRFGQAAEGLPEKKQFKGVEDNEQAEAKAEAKVKVEADDVDRFWMVGGTIRSEKALEKPKLILVEYGQNVPVREDGRFIIGNLEMGEYTLELSAEDRKPSQHKITVPAKKGENYDLKI